MINLEFGISNHIIETMSMRITFLLLVVYFIAISMSFGQELPIDYYESMNLSRYQEANERLLATEKEGLRVVMMGNSITEGWPVISPSYFEESKFIGRGIGGQTTAQMLLRFRNDVLDLNPDIVVILAGINDIAQNTGFVPIENIAANIFSMADLARANGAEVILCAVLPAIDFPWRRGLEPVNKVIKLNQLLAAYAATHKLNFVDYHSAMKDDNNGLKVPDYTTADDLVHPNAQGYAIMEGLLDTAINKLRLTLLNN